MKNCLSLINKKILIYLGATISISLFSPLNYAANYPSVYIDTIQNPSDGYTINLSASNVQISKTPTIASNGDFFYQVGPTFKVNKGVKGQVQSSGMVNCMGSYVKQFPEGTRIRGDNHLHRIFVYSPQMPYTLNGLPVFQLSYNTFVTIVPPDDILNKWNTIRKNARFCNPTSAMLRDYFTKGKNKNYSIDKFYYQFPFEISVFIRKRNIDGITIIPSSDFAGYARAWTNIADTSLAFSSLPQSMPISSTTAPMRLIGATLISPAECRTDVGYNLVINHGVLNAEKYESRVVRPINFSCDHVVPTPVEFELLYTKDGDPQQRLPLKVDGTNKTIYSKIQMIDAETGNRGQRFTSRVGQYKQIQIESILKGTNASGGNYSGTAVLIAAYP
ncbi:MULTISPECIES: hypothetical protein [Proteus]|jgi:hypothetical protein|uniref:Fimbrial adhesin n=2 Tax=Proteus vulgaris TaxID=585 RepID=A0A379F7M4_PROVU|nr:MULTISPECIES: hypothetical protein [Proteus]RNT23433.1 hypothetical protein B9475_016590 [Proteus mirabilis]AYY82818.1 hypothetical protein EGX81_18985 [Proteus vulgaris]KGA56196.1 hypothetical protein DR95_3567 [Proteus vulgaris]MBG5972068.1 hypothetical protein [Proteus vulgaris]MBG5986066.1 hypothetical protein [Proteus vulgaris]